MITSSNSVPVTVAIPTIGRIAMLNACLRSIAVQQIMPTEILLLDQSDSEVVVSLASSYSHLPIRVLRCTGRGIARNINLGIRESTNELMLVTHDDCTVNVDWVAEGYKALKRTTDTIITGQVFPGGEKDSIVPSTKIDPEPKCYSDKRSHGILYPNNMGFYKSAISAIGGFDERRGFETAAEDLDLEYRWMGARNTICYAPAAQVTHNDWRSPNDLIKLYKHYARCAGRFYGKHLGEGDLGMCRRIGHDMRNSLFAWKNRVRTRTSRWNDERLELFVWVPIGVVEGFCENWRLRRQARHKNIADH